MVVVSDPLSDENVVLAASPAVHADPDAVLLEHSREILAGKLTALVDVINLGATAFSVSRSGYYRWHGRPESRRAIENRRLNAHIKTVYETSKRRYGSPRIAEEVNDMGFAGSKNRVARRMKATGLRSIIRRKYRATTDSKHAHPVAENLLQRDFTASSPDKVWVSDIIYIATAGDWLYLCSGGHRIGVQSARSIASACRLR